MSQTSEPLMGTMTEKLLSLGTEVYHYAAVKGSPFATDCHVFGMTQDEVGALCKRFPDSGADIINGLLIKGSPIDVINALAELGYRVICSTGEAEVLWTLQREL